MSIGSHQRSKGQSQPFKMSYMGFSHIMAKQDIKFCPNSTKYEWIIKKRSKSVLKYMGSITSIDALNNRRTGVF